MRDCKTCVDYGNCTVDDIASCAHGDNIGHSDYRPKTSEYIKREDAIKSLLTDVPEQVSYSREDAIDCIKFIDAADVAPVRHGKWITTSGEVFPGSSQFLCYSHKHEECGFQYVDMNENGYDYCPSCGTIMDLED